MEIEIEIKGQKWSVASKFAKKIFVTSDNPRGENPESIIRDILSGIKNRRDTRAIVDRGYAIYEALKGLERQR